MEYNLSAFRPDKGEFKTAFGCELIALAKPATSDETVHQWAGQVNDKGVLAFTKLPDTDLTIKAGAPYLMQASGTQTACLTTISGAENMEPETLMKQESTYYAHIGEKLISVVPPYEVKASYSDNIVNGDFFSADCMVARSILRMRMVNLQQLLFPTAAARSISTSAQLLATI